MAGLFIYSNSIPIKHAEWNRIIRQVLCLAILPISAVCNFNWLIRRLVGQGEIAYTDSGHALLISSFPVFNSIAPCSHREPRLIWLELIFHFVSMEFTSVLWISHHFYGFHIMSMDFTSCLWTSPNFCGFHLISMDSIAFLLISPHFYGLHCISMDFTLFLWISHYVYGFHLISIDFT